MKAQPNLMSLQEAMEVVRTFSGEYPVCIVTSQKGAETIGPILEGCNCIVNGVKVQLIVSPGCKNDAVFFLRQMELDVFLSKSGRNH